MAGWMGTRLLGEATRGEAGGARHGACESATHAQVTGRAIERHAGQDAGVRSGVPDRPARAEAAGDRRGRRCGRPGPSSRGSAFSCGHDDRQGRGDPSSAPKIGAATLTSGCGDAPAERRQALPADLGERAAQRGGGDGRPSRARAPAAGPAPPPGTRTRRRRAARGPPRSSAAAAGRRRGRAPCIAWWADSRSTSSASLPSRTASSTCWRVTSSRSPMNGSATCLRPWPRGASEATSHSRRPIGEPAVGAALERAPGHQPAGQPQRRSWSGCRCGGSARPGSASGGRRRRRRAARRPGRRPGRPAAAAGRGSGSARPSPRSPGHPASSRAPMLTRWASKAAVMSNVSSSSHWVCRPSMTASRLAATSPASGPRGRAPVSARLLDPRGQVPADVRVARAEVVVRGVRRVRRLGAQGRVQPDQVALAGVGAHQLPQTADELAATEELRAALPRCPRPEPRGRRAGGPPWTRSGARRWRH